MRAIVPPGKEEVARRFGFSAAAISSGLVFVSGVLGVRADGSLAADPATQFTDAFVNLDEVLRASGSGPEHLVELTSFHVGLRAHLEVFVVTKASWIREPHPAWTAIGVAELALPGALIEVRALAETADD